MRGDNVRTNGEQLCPLCGWGNWPIGVLGKREQYRCRECGAEYTWRIPRPIVAETPQPIDLEDYVEIREVIEATRPLSIGSLYALTRDVGTIVKLIGYTDGVVTVAHNAMRAEDMLPSDLSAEMHPDCGRCCVPLYAADDDGGIVWDGRGWSHAACAAAEPHSDAARIVAAAQRDADAYYLAAAEDGGPGADRLAILDAALRAADSDATATVLRRMREDAERDAVREATLASTIERVAARHRPDDDRPDYGSLFAGVVIGDMCPECRQTDVHLWGCMAAQLRAECGAEAYARAAARDDRAATQARENGNTYVAKFAERDAHDHRVKAADRRAAAEAHRVARRETTLPQD